MNTELHSRRQQAEIDLGVNDQKEQTKMNIALQKEQCRQSKKIEKRVALEYSASYLLVQKTAKVMDKYCLDPLMGLIPGGVGDYISSVCVLPFIYVSLFKVRSLPLTLAVIFNVLVDMLLGIIPFLGIFIDFVNRCYIKNMRLITGYIEDDRETIRSVNKKAFWMFLGICLICYLIYLAVKIVVMFTNWLSGLF